jgi:energy-coupling factor transport system permease protein
VRTALAYAPRPGPLGSARPWIAALYLGPLAVVAFTFSNPLVLLGAGLAAIVAAAASGALRAALGPLRFGAALAATLLAVNALVSQRGQTVLVRGWELPVLGRVDVSAEALAEGGVLALRILVALAVFAVWSACVDPDRILKSIRPLAARSALAATLISRLVPLAAADSRRLAEASELRGPAAASVGRAAIARRLIAGSLDRSVDIAATLELRGYGLDGPIRRPRYRRHRGEPALALAGLATAVAAASTALVDAGGFEAYPTIVFDRDPATLALAAALPLLVAVPFLSPRELHRLRAGRRARRIGFGGADDE